MFAHPAVGSTGALQLCGPGGVVGCATSTARGIPPGRAPLPAPAEPRGLTAGPDAEEAWAPHTPSPPPVAGAPAFARPGPPAPASGKAPRPAPRSPDRPTAVTATAAAAAQASRLAGPRSVAALAAAAVAARSASASPHALAAALRAAGMAASVAGGDDGSPEVRLGWVGGVGRRRRQRLRPRDALSAAGRRPAARC